MIQNILYSLLFLSLLGGEVLRLQFPNSVAVSFLDISVFLFVLLSLFSFHKTKNIKNLSSFSKPLIIFFALAVFSLLLEINTLTANEIGISSLYLIRLAFYLALLFVVGYGSGISKKYITTLQITSGGLFVLLGFLQYFFYPALRNLYYLGWDEHLYRLFSTFLDPNFASAFLVLYGFLLFFQFKKQKTVRTPQAYFLLAGIILTLIAVILTFSRSGYLMLIFMAVLYVLTIGKKKYILVIFVACLLLVISLLPFSHIENTDIFRTASSKARLTSDTIALQIFLKKPLLGVGFNAYRYAQVQYGFRPAETPFPSHANAGTDNSFLFLLATTGILGTMAFGFFIYRLLVFSWQRYKKQHSQMGLLFLLSLAGLLVDSLFLNSLFYPPLMAWVFILGGLMIRDSL